MEHIVFRNEENGYTVLNLTAESGEITCVGNFQAVHEGEYLEAEGEYTTHAAYGQQFRAETYRIKIPESGLALERYLGSGALKGIGPALAARIVRRFGEDTLRIMEEEPERLSEIKGISEKKAREIGEQMIEKSQMQNAMIFLAQYGISLSLGIKIYNQYQDALYRVLKENPYRMAEDIPGVGFRIADEIAARIGIRVDSGYRLQSGLYYVLGQAGAQGHLYLPRQELLYRAGQLLGVQADTLEKHLMDLAIDRKVILKEERQEGREPSVNVYTSQAYYLELNTARMLQELNIVCADQEEKLRQNVARMEKSSGIVLDEGQRQAVVQAVKNGLMILTGGPGTGKNDYHQRHDSVF